MTFTELGPAEATELTWADIDNPNARVHIQRSRELEGGNLVIHQRRRTARRRRTPMLSRSRRGLGSRADACSGVVVVTVCVHADPPRLRCSSFRSASMVRS